MHDQLPDVSSHQSLRFLQSPLHQPQYSQADILLFSLLFPQQSRHYCSVPVSLESPSRSRHQKMTGAQSQQLQHRLQSSSHALLSLLPFRAAHVRALPETHADNPAYAPLLSHIFLHNNTQYQVLLLQPLSDGSCMMGQMNTGLQVPLQASDDTLVLRLPKIQPDVYTHSVYRSTLLLQSPSAVLPHEMLPLSDVFHLSLHVKMNTILYKPVFFWHP